MPNDFFVFFGFTDLCAAVQQLSPSPVRQDGGKEGRDLPGSERGV